MGVFSQINAVHSQPPEDYHIGCQVKCLERLHSHQVIL
jgi:hypothetical protein